MKYVIITFRLIFLALGVHSQATSDSIKYKMYFLGEVVISEHIDKNTLSADEIRKNNANDVSSALNLMPSVVINKVGNRNESTVYIRGFDIRGIPVFIDGIPVYVPYDGYVDLARFTTYDISGIDVSKGFSSMMYGANTIGGAINLISAKPKNRLEIDTRLGMMSGKGYDTKVNIGSNMGKMYFQAGLSILERKFFPLSAHFDTTPTETDNKRDNSNRKDMKGNFKIGYTPNGSDEYAINYIYSHGSKGNPVYLGHDDNMPLRYWDWPYWDKQSLYFISKTTLGTNSYLKTRFYFDQFKNRLDSYDDESYSSQTRGYAFTSFYDDHTLGGNLELVSNLDNKNTVKFSVHLKNDNHSEHNAGEPLRRVADNTISLGIEHILKAGDKLSFIPGFAYHLRQSLQADNYNPADQSISQFPKNTNDAFNAQLGTYYRISDFIRMNFNMAYKTRFATMKDRYSYRSGRSLANPGLRSESALSFEYATSFSLGEKLALIPEIFFTRLNNTIQMVDNVRGNLSQVQNTGKANYTGADISLIYTAIKKLRWHTSYSYIKRENLSNSDILFTDIPEHKVLTSLEYLSAEIINGNLTFEYNSGRNSSSDGSRISSAYFLTNVNIFFSLSEHSNIETGVNNILDKNYTIEEGYPEMGRNFYFALNFTF